MCSNSVQFQMEIRKFSRHRLPRSSDCADLGHFKLLFCRGRQRNFKDVQGTCTLQPLFCSLNFLFVDRFVAVVVVVCSSPQVANFSHVHHCSRVSHLQGTISSLFITNFFTFFPSQKTTTVEFPSIFETAFVYQKKNITISSKSQF